MSRPDFERMNQKELKNYFLTHRNDRDAFYAYVDRLHSEGNWVDMPPLASEEDLTNYPDFIEHFQGNESK